MEDRLIFRYHLDRANPQIEFAKETPLLVGEGLPTRSAVGKRRGDAGGYVDPGDGCSWGKGVGRPGRQIRRAAFLRPDAEPL